MTISDFTVDRGSLSNATKREGEVVSGKLPGPVTFDHLHDDASFKQRVKFGTGLHFNIAFSGEAVAPHAIDAVENFVSFSLLDDRGDRTLLTNGEDLFEAYTSSENLLQFNPVDHRIITIWSLVSPAALGVCDRLNAVDVIGPAYWWDENSMKR